MGQEKANRRGGDSIPDKCIVYCRPGSATRTSRLPIPFRVGPPSSADGRLCHTTFLNGAIMYIKASDLLLALRADPAGEVRRGQEEQPADTPLRHNGHDVPRGGNSENFPQTSEPRYPPLAGAPFSVRWKRAAPSRPPMTAAVTAPASQTTTPRDGTMKNSPRKMQTPIAAAAAAPQK